MNLKPTLRMIIMVTGLVIYAPLGMGQTIQQVKLAIDPWYPWVKRKLGSETTGVGVELIKVLYQRMGIEIKIELYPLKRVIFYLREGIVDGSWLITKNIEREKFALFSDPFFSDYYIYFPANRIPPFEWNTWEDLQQYKIGLSAGFDYGKEFHAAQKKYKYRTKEVQTDLQIIKMLLRRRVDLIILNRTVANAIQKDNMKFKGRLRPAIKPIKKTVFYVLLSKKSLATSLTPQVNATIKKMREDGTIQKILKKH